MTKWIMSATPLAALMLVGTVAAARMNGMVKRSDPGALAAENVKEILLVMDTEKNGKITRE